MPIKAGRMRARVEFQTERRVEDASGGAQQGTWHTISEVRGDYLPERGREAIANGHLQGSNLGTLRVRYSRDLALITTQARCLINGDVHQIRSITDPEQKRQMLEMVVERQVAPFS